MTYAGAYQCLGQEPQITQEYMRALEARLTPAQKQRAFALAEANGWKSTDTPPMWVWQQLFIQAIAEVPPSASAYAPDRTAGTLNSAPS